MWRSGCSRPTVKGPRFIAAPARACVNDGSSWTAAAPTPGSAPFAGGIAGDFDANLDGMFSSADIVLIFQAGEPEDSRPGNSTWAEGDWNSHGNFSSADLILAFQGGGYTSEAQIRHNSSTLSRISPATAAAIERSNDSNRREYTSQEADRPSIRILPAQIDFDRQAALVSPADQSNDTLFNKRDVNDWG